MKRVIKIVLLSFLVVIAAFGLAIGGMYLFGGFNEKNVYADNISFSTTSVISADSFALKISTTTEGVTKNKLKLSVLAGGESVIDFPTQVEIGKIFTVKPKQKADGSNFGGNATLIASYDDDNANPSVVAKCEILIDVPVKSITLQKQSFTTEPNQIETLCTKDSRIETVFGINPARALMPYVEYGTQVITGIADKALYLELVDELGSSLDPKVAQFVVNDVAQQTNIIKVNYSYRDVNGDGSKEIVFDDTITIASKETQSKAKLNAYVYSTYKEQTSNTIEGTLQLNKESTKNNDLGFTIGNYKIVDMNISATTEEIFIKEDSKIYLNNTVGLGDNDINLGLTLTTGSVGIEAGDYYLLKTSISVEGNNYVKIKRLNDQNDSFAEADDGSEFDVNYEGISTEKNNWGWVLNIDSFNAYSDYLSTGEPVLVKIKYYDEDTETSFERSFELVPKIVEVETFDVKYPEGKTSFEVESGSLTQLDNSSFNFAVKDGDKIPDANDTDNNNIPDNYKIEYYLSLTENYKNGKTTVSTVPNKVGVYKVKFGFVVGYENVPATTLTLNYDSTFIRQTSLTLKQGGSDITGNIIKDQLVEVEFECEILDASKRPADGVLFSIGAVSNGESIPNIIIEDYKTKFYEAQTDASGEVLVDNGHIVYSDLPYLAIDNVKYGVDFSYYYDEATYTNYLKINNTNGKVEGIGEFFITAQVVYEEPVGQTTQTYWLGKSAIASITSYQNLSEITATSCNADGTAKDDGVFDTQTAVIENDGVARYIYITSAQLDALTNYINAGQVEVFAEQCIDDAKATTYAGVKDINKDTISLGDEFIPVIENGNVVGYKLSYSVGKVSTIKINTEELENKFRIVIRVKTGANYVEAKFKVDTASDPTNYPAHLEVNVQDVVLQSATITYNDDQHASSNPLSLYATIDGGQLKYKAGGSVFEANELVYGLQYVSGAGLSDTVQTLTYELVTADSSAISLSGVCSFASNDNGKGGLVLNNFPYNADGVLLKLRVFSGTNDEVNTYYNWDSDLSTFVLTQYSNLSAEIYFKIFGLQIDITSNANSTFVGTEEGSVKVFGDLFELSIKNGDGGTPTGTINPQTVLNTYINKDYLFAKNGDLLKWDNTGTTLTFAKDLISDEDVDFKFYVGSTTNDANTIKINETAASYTQKFTSPFVVSLSGDVRGSYDEATQKYNVTVSAPSENISLVEYIICDKDGNALSDQVAAKANKIESESLTFDILDFDESCGVSDPIIKNEDNTLTFKAVPCNTYTAEATFVLTTKNNEVREVKILITITSALRETDIQIGTKVDAVPGESEEYYYITAGLDKEYSFSYTSSGGPVSDGIVLDGVLMENIANISDVSISFADNYGSDILEKDKVFVDKHMSDSSTWKNSETKHINISSDDLKDEKTVIVTINIEFINGGKFVYEKEIVVRPNVSITLDITSLREGQEINLLDYLKKDGEVFDIPKQNFEYEQTDNTQNYCKNSFVVDTQNAFTDTSELYGNTTYAIAVKSGAATNCGGKTTIGFYYIVSNGYTLYFEFEVLIFSCAKKDSDIVIGTKVEAVPGESEEYYYITAGLDNEYSITNGGIVLSGALAENKANIANVTLTFADNYDAAVLERDRVYVASHMSTTSWDSVAKDIGLSSNDLKDEKIVTVTINVEFCNGALFVYEKEIVVKPNVSVTFAKTSLTEGEEINLLDLFKKNGQNFNIASVYDSQETNNVRAYCKNSFDVDSSTVFEDTTNEDKKYEITVKTNAATASGGKTTIGFYYIASNSYTLYFEFEVDIVAAAS